MCTHADTRRWMAAWSTMANSVECGTVAKAVVQAFSNVAVWCGDGGGDGGGDGCGDGAVVGG